MVLDASMPDMDGLEALPDILEASPDTRVAVLSGFGGQALELAAMELGAARISAERIGGTVEIGVTDSGEGIPAELQPRLFERFARGAGRRDRGTGLGLFIVRELARVQGGDARYETPDGAPRFVVTLSAPHSATT